jgi:hypothetical protein
MSIKTNLHGRLRNTSLPKSHGLMPLFEAVVNSIHSIEEDGLSSAQGNITVEILRSPQGQFVFDNHKKGAEASDSEEIIGFRIIDNGIGFNDANMKSFETLDSEHKLEKGCRGVGRLLWLKAFNRITIESIYSDDGNIFKSRNFFFNTSEGVSEPVTKAAPSTVQKSTHVLLEGFVEKYRVASHKTINAIANSLFEHCLWYFVRQGGAPKIIIRDNDQSVDLDQVYEDHMHSSSSTETIVIKNFDFNLTHVKLRANTNMSHVIAFCATNRLVKEENIAGKIPGLYGKIKDINGEFIYACYIGSPFLDKHVRSERTGFDISEEVDGLFEDTEISLNEIRSAVIISAKNHLSEYLKENINKGKERIDSFVSQKAPRYRSILSRIPEDKLYIDPNISDKDLDITLHKHLYEIENKLLADGHEIMDPKEGEEYDEYERRLQEYLDTAEDIKKSDLANYVSHRKVVLDLLEKAIQRQNNGKYAREHLIHKLIMPMGKDSSQVAIDSCNLWLIDERLAFHNYLASDKTLSSMPITGSTETKEPDICALNIYDNPILVSEGSKLPLASIVVVEIKRPMRNDANEGEEKDPIEQALGYLNRIRQGSVETSTGRPIPHSDSIPGFCYVICDITPSIQNRCTIHDAVLTSDGLGYFFYHKNYKSYVEVISFDRLVNSAKERNRAFFDKLGLPTS